MIPLFYLDTPKPSALALRAGVDKLLDLAADKRQAAIAAHDVEAFSPNLPLAQALPAPVYATLKMSHAVTYNAVKVFVLTDKLHPSEFLHGSVLAIAPTPALWATLLADPRCTHLIYVPGSQDERESFKRHYPKAQAITF
jgi:hypothetical protein